jgi:2'-5' RNA ligase
MKRDPRWEQRQRQTPGRDVSAAPGPRARLFVALDLPATARDALAEWRDELIAGRDDLRPTRPETLHVTLAFLGWRAEGDVERVSATALGAAEGLPVPVLTPGGLRAVPAGSPRVFALDLEDEDGRAGALQDAVSAALSAERLYKPEPRPFWPHVTLARVRKGERAAAPLPDRSLGLDAFEAPEVVLYRSTLKSSGAVYDVIATHRLGSAS